MYRRTSNILTVLASLLLGVALTAHVQAQAPSQGSQIENTAIAYHYNSKGQLRSTKSNTVVAMVGAAPQAVLEQDRTAQVAPGQVVTLSHVLRNTGNGEVAFSITAANVAGDDFNPTLLEVYVDENQNGVVDSGDTLVASIETGTYSPVTIPAAGSASLLLRMVTPVNAAVGKLARVQLSAQGASLNLTNTDTLEVTGGAAMTLTKAASATSVARNEELSYALQLTNNGNTSADLVDSITVDGISYPLTLDGQVRTKVVIHDRIPANTTFVSAEPSGGGEVAYHQHGDAPFAYLSTPPSDLRQVDEVALLLPGLDARRSVQFPFTVRVNGNASGPINNVSWAYYEDSGQQQAISATSNEVVTDVPVVPPTIAYYSASDFADTTDATKLGQPLYVEADAAYCNTDPQTVEVRTIVITSGITGDLEEFLATETAANSGLFRIVPTADGQNLSYVPTADYEKVGGAQQRNGTVETTSNDILTATLSGCGTSKVETRILVDPAGYVFAACNDAVVPGTRVVLVDAVSGMAAEVYELDGVTPAPNDITTGADGHYEFPLVNPGVYKLLVYPPPGFEFPSKTAVGDLPNGRIIEVPASFGGEFPVNVTTGAVFIDVPLDCTPNGVLFVSKSVSRSQISVGDVVTYTVKVRNAGINPVDAVKLTDDLPFGFSYQPGTARLDDQPLADPKGGQGPRLKFAIGTLAPDAEVTLTYRTRAGIGALDGDGINTVVANGIDNVVGGITRTSNTATAKVEVIPDVFTDEAYVVGKVYTDCNRNRVQDPEELGVPGVRLFTDDGTLVITDSEGKYSLYGLRPRTGVIKVDPTTLPRGAQLITLDNRNAGDPNSRFIDLRKGELHRADFAIDGCDAEVQAQVHLRRTKGEVFAQEQYLKEELPIDATRPLQQEVRSLPAKGLVGGGELEKYEAPAAAGFPAADDDQLLLEPLRTAAPVSAVPPVPLETVMEGELDTALDFLVPADGSVLPHDQVTIRVKGRTGSHFQLTANGRSIDEDRVGKKSVNTRSGVEAWEFVAVKLEPGRNDLEVKVVDPWGNVRAEKRIAVTVPGQPDRFLLELPAEGAVADGNTPVPVTIRLVDKDGTPVATRLPITLESSAGRWKIPDLDEVEPGVQQFIEGGSFTTELLPPTDPAEAQLRVSSAKLSGEQSLTFRPHLRDMVAVGFAEGLLRLDKLTRSAMTPVSAADAFEDELRHYAWEGDNGRAAAGARGSLFLKGKVKGEYLLTLAYDSDKADDRLFRDIRPDEFYPIYGDASIRGYDAQSTGPLYVRIDKDRSSLLYGDYATGTNHPARKLGNYNRAFTGLQGHHEVDRVQVDAFAAQNSSRQVVEEIPGRGISGPYQLTNSSILLNSEQVELLVRDRTQPSLILERIPQTRFVDYEVDQLSGGLLFRRPIPSTDPNLNPMSIEVTYEVEQGGEEYWTTGVAAQTKVNERLEVGGSVVRDDNPQEGLNLSSVNATVKLAEGSFVTAEVARTDSDAVGVGEARRLELTHRSDRADLRIHVSELDEEFDNPSAGLVAGRREMLANGAYTLTDTVRLKGELLQTEDLTNDGVRRGAAALVEKRFESNVNAAIGVRYADDTQQPAQPGSIGTTPREQTSVRGQVGWQVPDWPELSLSGVYEQDTSDSERQLAAIGADYQLFERGRLYARHEFISSLTGPYGLNGTNEQQTTLVGLDMAYIDDARLFSEYRVRDAIDGYQSEAAIGLRNRWRVSDGLALDTGFERVQPVNGQNDSNRSTAVTGAIQYTRNPLWVGTARLEVRRSPSEDSLLNTLGLARKLDRNWSFLGRNHFYYIERETGDIRRDRLQLGLAYRDTDVNVWNALGKYELRTESDDTIDTRRTAHILAGNINYALHHDTQISGRVAAKWVEEGFDDGYQNNYSAYLLGGRYLHDLTDRWDLGLNGSLLTSQAESATRYALGLELGYLVTTNLWLSGGYNVSGFRDEELAGSDFTQEGAYLRLRFKFDETLFADKPY